MKVERNMKVKIRTKSKKSKTSKIKSIKPIIIEQELKREDRNGFPDPIPAQCFQCQKQF